MHDGVAKSGKAILCKRINSWVQIPPPSQNMRLSRHNDVMNNDFTYQRPQEKQPLTTVEVVETMRQFKELYNAIKLKETDRALQIYQEISPEVVEVLESLLEGPHSIVPEEEKSEIEQQFKQIKGTKVDLISRVKLALEGINNPKEFVKTHLEKFLYTFEQEEKEEALKHLGHVREFMFPSSGETPFDPEHLSPEFIEFLDDDGMWEWIAEKKSGVNELDEEALKIIYNSVKDLLDRDALFSDIIVEEEEPLNIEAV